MTEDNNETTLHGVELLDQPTALLTERQRKFLCGVSDLSARGERSARRRIRDRLRASLLDLQLIVSTMSLDDLDKALSEPEEYELEPGTMPPVANCLPALATVLYLARENDNPHWDAQTHLETTVTSVEMGIQQALNRRGVSIKTFELDGELALGHPLDLLAKGDLSGVTRKQLLQLALTDRITDEQYANEIADRMSDEE